jgi:hypothetical protein
MNQNQTIDQAILVERLRAELSAARATIGELAAGSNGDVADSWLQRKVVAQARALNRLNSRVSAQRFVLRQLEARGRGLSAQEAREGREAEARPALGDDVEYFVAELVV